MCQMHSLVLLVGIMAGMSKITGAKDPWELTATEFTPIKMVLMLWGSTFSIGGIFTEVDPTLEAVLASLVPVFAIGSPAWIIITIPYITAHPLKEIPNQPLFSSGWWLTYSATHLWCAPLSFAFPPSVCRTSTRCAHRCSLASSVALIAWSFPSAFRSGGRSPLLSSPRTPFLIVLLHLVGACTPPGLASTPWTASH